MVFGARPRLLLLAMLHRIWYEMWERGIDQQSRGGRAFDLPQWQQIGMCLGPPAMLQWQRSAPWWFLAGAHLVNTLDDPPPGPWTAGSAPSSSGDPVSLSAAGLLSAIYNEEEPEELVLFDSSPISFLNAPLPPGESPEGLCLHATGRARQWFHGDDDLLLTASRSWPFRLVNDAWWTFEQGNGDKLYALCGVQFRELLPMVIDWRAKGGRDFVPYIGSIDGLALEFRPEALPWINIEIRWSLDVHPR